jgi:hypothetical protein
VIQQCRFVFKYLENRFTLFDPELIDSGGEFRKIDADPTSSETITAKIFPPSGKPEQCLDVVIAPIVLDGV